MEIKSKKYINEGFNSKAYIINNDSGKQEKGQ